jgi:hypothetical protein
VTDPGADTEDGARARLKADYVAFCALHSLSGSGNTLSSTVKSQKAAALESGGCQLPAHHSYDPRSVPLYLQE